MKAERKRADDGKQNGESLAVLQVKFPFDNVTNQMSPILLAALLSSAVRGSLCRPMFGSTGHQLPFAKKTRFRKLLILFLALSLRPSPPLSVQIIKTT